MKLFTFAIFLFIVLGLIPHTKLPPCQDTKDEPSLCPVEHDSQGTKGPKAIQNSQISTSLPNLVFLALGGTVSAEADSPTNTSHYTVGALSIHSLLQNITERWSDYANVIPYQLMSLDSIDMNSSHMISISQRVTEELNKPYIAGVVLLGGTDAMIEYLTFIGLTVKSEKPIVGTGAYKPHTAYNADGPQNIIDAVILAATKGWSGEYYEVAMVMGGDIFRPWGIRKENDKFVPGLGSSIGRVDGYEVSFRDLPGRPAPLKFNVADLSSEYSLPVVLIFLVYTGFDYKVIERAVDEGARGAIIGVYGNGYIPAKAGTGIRKLMDKSDIVIIGASFGSVTVSYARVEGMIPGQDWDGRQLRILAQLYLVKGEGITRHDLKKALEYGVKLPISAN